jgi:hypothetical protein
VKHVERQFLSRFPIAGDTHDQGENDLMRLRVELMQRKLVASGDGPDEPDPFFL